ncbi:MAG: hypothetical protein AAGE59_05120 [Cyanobacteria bacterium P01_F01_bin.86]
MLLVTGGTGSIYLSWETLAAATIDISRFEAIAKKEVTRSERWVSCPDANLQRYIHFEKCPKRPVNQVSFRILAVVT